MQEIFFSDTFSDKPDFARLTFLFSFLKSVRVLRTFKKDLCTVQKQTGRQSNLFRIFGFFPLFATYLLHILVIYTLGTSIINVL